MLVPKRSVSKKLSDDSAVGKSKSKRQTRDSRRVWSGLVWSGSSIHAPIVLTSIPFNPRRHLVTSERNLNYRASARACEDPDEDEDKARF